MKYTKKIKNEQTHRRPFVSLGCAAAERDPKADGQWTRADVSDGCNNL